MKRNVSLVGGILLVGLLFNGCEDSSNGFDKDNLSLKESVTVAAVNIDEALEIIEKSAAFDLLVDQQSGLKSVTDDEAPATEIMLDDLKGVYEYAPSESHTASALKSEYYTFFNRIGVSDNFIIHLPYEKVTNPNSLYSVEEGDDELENNFKITTTDFIYQSTKHFDQYKYVLETHFDKVEAYVGSLWVEEEKSGVFNINQISKFGFNDAYFVKSLTSYADTLKLEFNLESDEDVLYGEKVMYIIKGDYEHVNERFFYILEVGDVKIIQKLDEEYNILYEVYKGGEWQEDATVEVIVTDEAETSVNCMFVNSNKDLKITFGDESTVVLSELIGDSRETLEELFSSMKELYLAKSVINQLAWKIYAEQLMANEED